MRAVPERIGEPRDPVGGVVGNLAGFAALVRQLSQAADTIVQHLGSATERSRDFNEIPLAVIVERGREAARVLLGGGPARRIESILKHLKATAIGGRCHPALGVVGVSCGFAQWVFKTDQVDAGVEAEPQSTADGISDCCQPVSSVVREGKHPANGVCHRTQPCAAVIRERNAISVGVGDRLDPPICAELHSDTVRACQSEAAISVLVKAFENAGRRRVIASSAGRKDSIGASTHSQGDGTIRCRLR